MIRCQHAGTLARLPKPRRPTDWVMSLRKLAFSLGRQGFLAQSPRLGRPVALTEAGRPRPANHDRRITPTFCYPPAPP